MTGIQGEIRDVYGEERSEEERRGETRRDETARCGFEKEMRDGGGVESGCRENVNRGKEDEPGGDEGQNM